MPPTSGDYVPPSTAQQYAGLTRASFRSLHAADLLPSPGKLTLVDLVLARLCRYVYWSGPSLTAPGQSTERDRQRDVAAAAVDTVRGILGKKAIPERVVVSLENGAVAEIRTAGDVFDSLVGDTALGGIWLTIPLREWWDEAQTLLDEKQTGPATNRGVVPVR